MPIRRVGWIVENRAAFVCEEARALARQGLDLRVASVFRPDSPARWTAAYGATVDYPARGRAGWARRALHDAAAAPPATARLLSCATRWRAPLRLVALALRLARRARREGWSHVHASFASQPAFVAWAVSQCAGIPWSLTGHAYDVQRPMPWLPGILPDARFARAISRETAARLAALAPGRPLRVRVGHLGVDLDRFRPRRAPLAPDAPIVSVANLVAPKGLDVLVRAAAALRRAGIAPPVRIFGDGPERGALLASIAAHGLSAQVRLEGAASRARVAVALAEASMFVLPCVVLPGRRHDGIPVALLEAMASERAVISTRVGGIPEAIEAGRDGVLVEPGEAAALAVAIAQLHAAPRRRAELARAARRRVERDFSLERSSSRLASWIAESGPSEMTA